VRILFVDIINNNLKMSFITDNNPKTKSKHLRIKNKVLWKLIKVYCIITRQTMSKYVENLIIEDLKKNKYKFPEKNKKDLEELKPQ